MVNVLDVPRNLRSLELFTGAGGLAMATHNAGFQHEGLFEWNRDACLTLRRNARNNSVEGIAGWDDRISQCNIAERQFDYANIDLVAGGPPCQPFSIGGRHKGNLDKRDMIPHFVRAVKQSSPRAFIMENVKGLTRKQFANYLSYTVLHLSYLGIDKKPGEAWEDHLRRLEQHHTSSGHSDPDYNVLPPRVLNAADYGVPQCRQRMFLVGFRKDVNADWSFPEPTHSRDALQYAQWIDRSYWDAHRQNEPAANIKRPSASKLEKLKRNGVPKEKPWVTVRDALVGLPEPYNTDRKGLRYTNHRFQGGARTYPGHTGSPLDGPSKTLKAGDHGVPGGENMIAYPDGRVRYFTTREAARMQTFPDDWYFEGAWSEAMRQLGNAVPVKLAEAVANSVAKALRREEL